MSNLLYDGFDFKELNSKFQLQNISPIYIGEIGQMRLPLLNNQNNGYSINTYTPYNSNPDFLLEKQINTNIVTLLKYDGTSDIFKFNKNMDLQNIVRISNSLDPINDKDLVTKSFLESSIGSFGPGSVTSLGVYTLTSGLSISGSPITTSGIITINLSNQLQEFSSLGKGTLNQVLSIGTGNSFNWRSVGTVTSVGITTSINSGIIVTNTPVTQSGNINIDLSGNLKDFNTLGYGLNGQILTMSNGTYSWSTPTVAGNVTGYPTTIVNGLALWNNTTGTSLGSTDFTLDVNGNLNLNSKRIVSAQNPVSNQDLATKYYVDLIASQVAGGLPIGAMTMWCAETLPSGGWLECDGAAISRTTYSTLFAVLGTRWGQGDGSTTFNLPDTRGLFPRGWNHSSTKAAPYNDPNASTRIASATGGVTGDHVGTLQADDLTSHTHTYTKPNNPVTLPSPTGGSQSYVTGVTTNQSTGNSPTSGGSETRPINFSIMFIIKAL